VAKTKGEQTGRDKVSWRTELTWLCRVLDDGCLADLLPDKSGCQRPREFE
jgi:hypothetical protein